MNQDLVKQIIASGAGALTELAKVAGSTAIHLYSIFVKQQIIEGAISILQLILGLIIGYFIGRRIYQWIKDYQNDENIGGGTNWLIGLGSASVCFIVMMAVLSALGTAINQIANPEYYAIKLIFEAVKK